MEIKQNYLSTDNDRMIAAKGLKLTRKIIMDVLNMFIDFYSIVLPFYLAKDLNSLVEK